MTNLGRYARQMTDLGGPRPEILWLDHLKSINLCFYFILSYHKPFFSLHQTWRQTHDLHKPKDNKLEAVIGERKCSDALLWPKFF